MSDIKEWFKPEKVGFDPISTAIWSGLFIGLWIVGLVHITESNATFSSEVLLFLSTGIGAYFAKKTSTDSEKDSVLYNDKKGKVRTTWGIKPRLARTIIVISLVAIYGIILIKQIFDTDPINITFLLSDEKYETISVLFWAFIGVYSPNLYSLFKGKKTEEA